MVQTLKSGSFLQKSNETRFAVYEDEYEAYNNIPKGLQNLERGQTMCEYLCDIEDDIRELVAIEENLNQIAERQSK